MTWRESARPIIDRTIAAARKEGVDNRELRRRLRDAYPWGLRAMHPYKIWCSEVRRQLGLERDRRFGKRVRTPLPEPQEQVGFFEAISPHEPAWEPGK